MDTDALISWYQQSRRTMPWREEVSPYRTLVSELMLQQTRVETVIPYFERFMRSFPTERALAEAPLERVLEHWSGLGYYSRARNLHAAARKVVELGGFPQTVAGLLELPGVGPYTAGAIASIALGLDAPLVDGNVERVLCRHDARAEDPVKIKKELWERATFLLPKGQASDFNQALMELGATVCTPSSPRCLFCPIRSTCHGHDAPERYPQKAPRAAVPEAGACAVLVRDGDHILMARRPLSGLLAGLWEPPMATGSDPQASVGARLGVTLRQPRPVGEVLHVFTHLRLTTQVFEAELVGSPLAADYLELRWVPSAEVDSLALSTLARKLLQAHGSKAKPRKPRAPRNPVLPS
jgi:A/G-specific adenine glycosylase